MTLCPCCGKPKKPKGLEALGTALKPAVEMIACARKPLACPTVAAQVLATGTGALNIDGCRVATNGERLDGGKTRAAYAGCKDGWRRPFQDDAAYMTERAEIEAGKVAHAESAGRFPPNLLHDGSPEVLAAFARFGNRPGFSGGGRRNGLCTDRGSMSGSLGNGGTVTYHSDQGSAARFFPALGYGEDELRFHYSSKAGKADRAGSKHPTVKPQSLLRWLTRLCCPPGGVILDPFAGSGSLGTAALAEGFSAILVEREAEYVADIHRRLELHRNAARNPRPVTVRNTREDAWSSRAAAGGSPAPIPQHDLFAELVA